MFSADDALLIDALQVAPRASWSAIGDLLGIAPVTAAKRWRRLSDEGLAWVTVAPGMAASSPQCIAFAEITCPASKRLAVAETIAQHPMAVTVELTTGDADIFVTVFASGLPMLSHYVLDHLRTVDGTLSTRLRVATRLYTEGGSWRLRQLPEATAAAFEQMHREEMSGGPADAPPGGIPDSARAIMAELSVDGRMSYADLAERINVSPATARRKVAELMRSGTALLRTDVAAPEAGWPVESYAWADVPIGMLSETARQLIRMRLTRLTATVAAGPKLVLATWLRTVEEVHRVELAIAEEIPHLQIIESLLVLRVVKRSGRLIDAAGRATGVVPVSMWDDEACEACPAP